MDPNANLLEQLELAHDILDPKVPTMHLPTDAIRLAELVQAMHEWIVKGGELPAFWKQT